MAALSLLWPIALAGVAVPSFATFPFGFVTVPEGYHGAATIAVVLVWLMVVTPVTKLLAIAQRHDAAHVPISVHPGRYDTVMDDLRATLERAGIEDRADPVHMRGSCRTDASPAPDRATARWEGGRTLSAVDPRTCASRARPRWERLR